MGRNLACYCAAKQIRLGKHGENGAVFGRGTSLSLSLSLLALFSTLKFLNALFVRFCALFVILSAATQRVARRKPQQKNPHKLKENLPFLDTSLALSMTNSGFCLKITDISTQNSRHFITLSQILSPTQGFFIFLPQIFYIFTQIAFKILKNLTQQRINNESQR